MFDHICFLLKEFLFKNWKKKLFLLFYIDWSGLLLKIIPMSCKTAKPVIKKKNIELNLKKTLFFKNEKNHSILQ
jgi:hypothetical protein